MTDAYQGRWRPMEEADLPAITAISDAVHGDYTEPMAVYAERLALYPDGCAALERDGAVSGFLVCHPWLGEIPPGLGKPIGAIPAQPDHYYLHDIALLPSERGSGAGKAAVALVEQQAARAGLTKIVLVAVNGADSFWSSQGFAYAPGGTSGPYGAGTFLMQRDL